MYDFWHFWDQIIEGCQYWGVRKERLDCTSLFCKVTDQLNLERNVFQCIKSLKENTRSHVLVWQLSLSTRNPKVNIWLTLFIVYLSLWQGQLHKRLLDSYAEPREFFCRTSLLTQIYFTKRTYTNKHGSNTKTGYKVYKSRNWIQIHIFNF